MILSLLILFAVRDKRLVSSSPVRHVRLQTLSSTLRLFSDRALMAILYPESIVKLSPQSQVLRRNCRREDERSTLLCLSVIRNQASC